MPEDPRICHVLGGKYDLPHAQTHAVVLPYVLAFNAPAAPDAEVRLAAAFGTDRAIDGLQGLRVTLDAPREFLTATGHITTERRQEFILLSDVLAASMQTVAINNEAYGQATEGTVFGPIFTQDAPVIEIGGDIAGGAVGEPCWVEGTVTGADGRPLVGARIEVWEADEDGFYDLQCDDHPDGGASQAVHRRPWGLCVLGPHADSLPYSA